MNTLRINFAIASVFLMTSVTLNAQTNKTKSTSVKQRTETKQQIELSNEIPSKSKTSTISATPAPKAQRPRKVSDYMSMEKKIMAWTIAGNIPASAPKHEDGQTKDVYKSILKNWAKSNLNLIKPEYHDRLLNPQPSK